MNAINEIEIEISLRDGLIEELTEHLTKSVEIIQRLISVVNAYQETIDECVGQRDRARNTAVRLEQECHSCADTVHHGNEKVYESEI